MRAEIRGSVVVTGTSSGIGQACAVSLDRLGFQVFAGVRREADGEALRQKTSGRLVPVLLEVTDAASILAAADMVAGAVGSGGLSGLVNNAGVVVGGPLEFIPVELVRRQLEVNVVGQVAVTQAFLPLLRQGRGRIVNMGSISGVVAPPFLGPYGASKFAMEALTDSLRLELRPWGIRVAIIEAGAIATPIWEKALASFDEMSRRLSPQAQALYGPIFAALREGAARPRGLPPEAVAHTVAHALTAKHPKTRYVVGRDARARKWLRFLPDRLRDWLVARELPGYG